MLERVWRKKYTITVGGNVNWCNHCGKQDGDSSKNHTAFIVFFRIMSREKRVVGAGYRFFNFILKVT